jgi:acyl-CoA thioester hydrolase
VIHETIFRVRYGETDAQRIANNANYLSYFEVGRVEWLRAIGFSYRELEDRGLGFVVVEARLFFKRPARFDDELTLRTVLAELGRASLRFEYAVLRDGAEIATGYTRHGCVDLATGRTRRLPAGFLSRVSEARGT